MKEAFEKVKERLENLKDRFGTEDFHIRGIIQKAIEIVKEVQEEYSHRNHDLVIEVSHSNNGWIPCSERLPKYDEKSEYYKSVIVTLDNGRVAEGCYRNLDKEWWIDAPDGEHFSQNMTGHVLAWQPLPTPYKPKGE